MTTSQICAMYAATEADRITCEARFVLGMPFADRKEYIAGVEQKRGGASANKLRAAIVVDWGKRNKRES